MVVEDKRCGFWAKGAPPTERFVQQAPSFGTALKVDSAQANTILAALGDRRKRGQTPFFAATTPELQ